MVAWVLMSAATSSLMLTAPELVAVNWRPSFSKLATISSMLPMAPTVEMA